MNFSLILVLIALFELSFSFNIITDECGGNCLTSSCQQCICGTNPNIIKIATVCNGQIWSSNCCQCIVKITSGGNTNAIFMSNNIIRAGLFQISSFDWITCNRGQAPCDPTINFVCALDIYKKSGNKWSTYWSEASQKCGCK